MTQGKSAIQYLRVHSLAGGTLEKLAPLAMATTLLSSLLELVTQIPEGVHIRLTGCADILMHLKEAFLDSSQRRHDRRMAAAAMHLQHITMMHAQRMQPG